MTRNAYFGVPLVARAGVTEFEFQRVMQHGPFTWTEQRVGLKPPIMKVNQTEANDAEGMTEQPQLRRGGLINR